MNGEGKLPERLDARLRSTKARVGILALAFKYLGDPYPSVAIYKATKERLLMRGNIAWRRGPAFSRGDAVRHQRQAQTVRNDTQKRSIL